MQYYNKTCVLCTRRISPRKYNKLCLECYKEYKEYITTDWFQELIKLQTKQDQIDRMEGYILPFNSQSDIHGCADKPNITVKKDIGRPSTEWKLVNEVLELFDKSIAEEQDGNGRRLSLRKLAIKTGNKVGYVTIRNILMMYRPTQFKARN